MGEVKPDGRGAGKCNLSIKFNYENEAPKDDTVVVDEILTDELGADILYTERVSTKDEYYIRAVVNEDDEKPPRGIDVQILSSLKPGGKIYGRIDSLSGGRLESVLISGC